MQTNHELLTDARSFLQDQLSGIEAAGSVAQSWDEFFAIYDGIIRRFARASGVSGDEVDECVQEVWVAIIAHLGGFEVDAERGRFRTWLYQVVRSKATDIVRRRNRPAISLDDTSETLQMPSEQRVDLVEAAWKRESLRTLLLTFRDRVNRESFELFQARGLNGEDYATIGERIGVKPATVRVRYHRLLEHFRELCRLYAVDDVTTKPPA